MSLFLWFVAGAMCGPFIATILAIALKIFVNAWIAHKEGKQ